MKFVTISVIFKSIFKSPTLQRTNNFRFRESILETWKVRRDEVHCAHHSCYMDGTCSILHGDIKLKENLFLAKPSYPSHHVSVQFHMNSSDKTSLCMHFISKVTEIQNCMWIAQWFMTSFFGVSNFSCSHSQQAKLHWVSQFQPPQRFNPLDPDARRCGLKVAGIESSCKDELL